MITKLNQKEIEVVSGGDFITATIGVGLIIMGGKLCKIALPDNPEICEAIRGLGTLILAKEINNLGDFIISEAGDKSFE